MWFVNLDQLPAGKSMYTIYLTADPVGTPRDEICSEEIDFVGDSRSSGADIVADAKQEIDETYGPEVRAIAVVNQSDDYVMIERIDGDLR